MKFTKAGALPIISLAILLLVGLFLYLYRQPVPLGQPYTNDAYGFSLRIPADYSVNDSTDSNTGNEAITFEDARSDGFQLELSAWDEATTTALTANRIKSDIPDMLVANPQPVAGGIAFDSDSPDWDGASHEIWFLHEGTLYQLTTYAKNKRLLDGVLRSWSWSTPQ